MVVMKKKIQASPAAKRQLKALGENIKISRLRRDFSLLSVAQRAGISVNTVVAIEKGEPGVSIGAVANVLHCLNLVEDISKVAQDDPLGRKLQDLKLEPRKRAAKKVKTKNLQDLIENSK
jgi:transcriptional regulator with XRE-family HTH domain